VDPRASAPPAIAALFAQYPHLDRVLPAVGYGDAQLEDLRRTIADSAAEVVVSGTPFDVARLVDVGKPVVRARYRYADADETGLGVHLDQFLRAHGLA
jgi:predicted GTPase